MKSHPRAIDDLGKSAKRSRFFRNRVCCADGFSSVQQTRLARGGLPLAQEE
jgi:hypothetical protein